MWLLRTISRKESFHSIDMSKKREHLTSDERQELLDMQQELTRKRRRQTGSPSFADRKIYFGLAGAIVESIDELLSYDMISSRSEALAALRQTRREFADTLQLLGG
jgi:hypothetical protein